MAKRVAVLDVGSNSVRMMTADMSDGRTQVVCRRTVTTRLMEAVQGGVFTQAGMERTAQAMRRLYGEAVSLGAEDIRAFGTSAMRDAENSDCLCHMAGMNIEIMAGDMEARLAYLGAAPRGECGVVDIGGGSTEMIVGRGGQAEKYISVNIGAVRLNMACGSWNAEELLDRTEKTLLPAKQFAGAGKWVGVGGTITTLAAMTRGVDKYTPGAIEGCPLTAALVDKWYYTLARMSAEERRRIPGLSASRADIIHCGAAILTAFMKNASAQIVFASDHDNLEGFIRYQFLKS